MELKIVPVEKEFPVEICGDSGVEFDLNDIFSLHPAARQVSSDVSKIDKSATSRELTFTTPHKTPKSSCLKSPFSLSSLGESPWSSPQSSTPISGEVSIAKSFETPSFHSPIILPGDSMNSFGYTRSAKMTSDTILTWETNMETPAQNSSSSSTQKLKSSSFVEFSTPPRPQTRSSQKATKKLFVSPNAARSDTKLSTSSGRSSGILENTSQKPRDESGNLNLTSDRDSLHLERSESENSKDFSLFSQLDDSVNEANSLAPGHTADKITTPPQIQEPTVVMNKEQPAPEKPEIIEDHADSFDTVPYSEDSKLEILTSDSAPKEELDKVLTRDGVSVTENTIGTNCATDSVEVNSLAISCNIESEDNSLAPTERRNFQYPTATQNHTQLQLGNQRDCDSIGFSQWPNEVYEHANAVVSNLDDNKRVSDKENCDNHNRSKQYSKDGLIDGNQDSMSFSQWPSDLYENLDKAIAVLENKKNVNSLNCSKQKEEEVGAKKANKEPKKQDCSESKSLQNNKLTSTTRMDHEERSTTNQLPLQKEFQGFTTASNKSITNTAAKGPSNLNDAHTSSVKKAVNFFGEDFSDLDTSKLPSFNKASLPVHLPPKVPKPKDPVSFFGEDFSDLDKIDLSNAGFKFASKVLDTTDKSKTFTDGNGDNSNPTFGGFSTASGKNVEFSEHSLNFVRSSQAPNLKNTCGKQVSFIGIPNAKDGSSESKPHYVEDKTERVDIADDSIQDQSNGSELLPSSQVPSKPVTMTGFSTASGNPVGVSDDALNHVRSSQVPAQQPLTGLSTAGGVPVNVTEKSLAAVRCSQAPRVSISTGFSTAGGAPVNVKEDALEFIRSSQAPKPSGVATGFATASGKGVSVSKESVDHIRSSQAVPASFSQKTSIPSSVSHSSKPQMPPKLFKNTEHATPITPIFKAGARSGLSLAQNSKRTRTGDQSKSEDAHTPMDKVRRRESSGSDQGVISRIRRESTDDTSSPIQYLSKRRRLSRRSGFNSPVTDKTRSRAVVSSPVSHRIRPGLSPLLSSPNLESTIEEAPAETTSFVTPYNKASSTAQPAPKKEAKTSMLWKQTTSSLPTSSKLIKPGSLSTARHPILSLPLPRYYESEELFELGVSCGVEEITALNAQEFRFTKPDYFLENDGEEVTLPGCGVVLKLKEGKAAGHSEFHQALITAPKIRKQFVSVEWVANHYRLIVWKCAGLERTQPTVYAGCSLTPENVMSQLLLRYSVEVEEGRRSAIRRITEKDDTPAKPMTLVVSGISSKTIEVSDGWYCLDCVLDNPLSVLIQSRAIKVGSKIVSFSSSILGTHTDGIPPLQAKSTLKLKLNYNCVRPAAWHATLGYTEVNTLPSLPLSVLAPDGGTCSCIEAILIRRYPVQYLETLASGKKVFRSEKEERKRQEEYDRTRDKIVEDITHKLSSKGQAKGSRSISKEAVKALDSGRELYEAMKDHPDPTSLQNSLTPSQRGMLAEYTEKERSRREVQHNKELLEELNERCPPRKVISLIKHKILCALQPNSKPYFLTTWRAEQQAPLKEGRCYKMYNISCSSYRGSGLSLSSSKSSMFREMKDDYSHLAAKPICTVSSVPVGCSECDLIGKVLQTDRQTDTRTVLVMGDTEAAGEVLVYNSTSEVKVGGVVCVVNLQVSKSGSFICNEKSSLSSSPRDKTLSGKLIEFRNSIADKPQTFWEALLASRSTKETTEPDHWDEVPDIPFEQFEGNTNKQTCKRTNEGDSTTVPLFSMVSGTETEELLGCSDRAKSDFQTPIKHGYYESIFE